jgi:uncharacterized YccA/Bax inhibitor family protein
MPSVATQENVWMDWKTVCAALVISCVCLSAFHFHTTVATVLFMIGAVGGFCMLLFTGVHGDFNAIGGIVYVLVNTLVFYGLIRVAIRIGNWVKNG